MEQEVWHPHSAQRRCDFHNGGFYFETFEELYWKERKCILTLCHKGEHELRLEREDETDEQYMDWYHGAFGIGAVHIHK